MTAALVLATAWACTPDSSPYPDNDPLSPQFAASACDLMSLDMDVKDYFLDNTQRKAAQDGVTAIEDGCGSDTATPAWALANLLSAAFNGGTGGAPAVGARIANRLLDCIASNTCAGSTALVPAAAFGPGGTYVPVGNGADPVLAEGPIGIISAQGNDARAWWGAELSQAGSSWSQAILGVLNGKALIYGSPNGTDFGGPSTDVSLANLGYEFFVYPDLPNQPFNPQIEVGVCFHPPEAGEPGDFTPRLQRESALLQSPGVPDFCNSLVWPASTTSRILDGLRSVLAFGFDLVRPDALSAAQFGSGLALLPPGIGGSASDFSRFKAISAIAVGGALQPVSFPSVVYLSQNNGAFTATVRAVSGGGTPTEGVPIELYILGNNGKPAGAIFVDGNGQPTTPTAITAENTGIATFNAMIDKPGGYSVCARVAGDPLDIAFADGCWTVHVRK